MVINNLLKEKSMSQYKLSKLSGVSQSTISDICTGKLLLVKCSGETLWKIAKALDVSIDSILDAEREESKQEEYRSSFETFKGNVCHYIKDNGDINFIITTLEKDNIRKLYKKKWYPEALYLLAMLDYLSRVNNLPLCIDYNDIRKHKLTKTIYPSSVIAKSVVTKSEKAKLEAKKKAIPEFLRFNIVECEVRNVV